MKYYLLTFFFLLSLEAKSQCDRNSVFSNDTTNSICNTIDGKVRTFLTNNLPDHSYGNWPSNNPVEPQEIEFKMCAFPRKSDQLISIYDSGDFNGCSQYIEFGVGANGIRIAPYGARWFVNPETQEENRDWNIEPLEFFNMDFNNSHSNQAGEYHYHGVPLSYFVDSLNINGSAHSPIVGYAADGFPIYYKYVYINSNNPSDGVESFSSGFTLKSGNRPGNGITAPDGNYDGLYVEDYEFLDSGWELDECNGRYAVTPEYPNGTYYYVMTDNWPYIPRCFYGSVIDNTFRIGPNCPESNSEMDCSNDFTSINEELNKVNLIISPNPSSGLLRIEGLNDVLIAKISQISIYDISGRVWYSNSELDTSIDLSNLPSGNYFLQISSDENQITKRVVIQ